MIFQYQILSYYSVVLFLNLTLRRERYLNLEQYVLTVTTFSVVLYEIL
jgi:hypothetical protein